MKNNIYLIGFMGCGKSYLGKKLAATLGYNFLDIDTFLVANEGKSITQIFAEGGESLFRKLERSYLHATHDFDKTIIATGGGVPCFFDNIIWMNENGNTIYLKTPIDILTDRLQANTAHRPLLAGKSKQELKQFIEKKLADRESYYMQARFVFKYITGMESVDDLLSLLNNKTNLRIYTKTNYQN